ncbi:acetamidase/formamidase family protein [Candidatus Acetothermia bacterium]|nr:acetamidase/formamidase family protein [Candidatus Acetothermia bacterium]MBI3660179.1 acetamidase/formamidase family protein [Candidatus Acetothermia bacterium]
MSSYRLDDTKPHAFWDNSYPPRLSIKPGDTVVFETLEASAKQITPASRSEALNTLNFDLIHPLTGPVYVKGAEPGDTLEVEVIRLEHRGWGWNAVIPGFGLLAEDFSTPYLHHYKLGQEHCEFRSDIRIPYEPFCGVMGVAPREPGRFNTIPPRENGGNLDIRHLTAGTRIFFPVLVPGALFSCGDCHSAQGDGEVNGTGIETPMTVTLRFNLKKGKKITELRFITPPGKRLTLTDSAGYFVTTAHGPDLFKNAQCAVRYMVDYLSSERQMTREQAYCLCGAAVDLKISEIVDAPNWIVSAYLPLSIFVKPKVTVQKQRDKTLSKRKTIKSKTGRR